MFLCSCVCVYVSLLDTLHKCVKTHLYRYFSKGPIHSSYLISLWTYSEPSSLWHPSIKRRVCLILIYYASVLYNTIQPKQIIRIWLTVPACIVVKLQKFFVNYEVPSANIPFQNGHFWFSKHPCSRDFEWVLTSALTIVKEWSIFFLKPSWPFFLLS